MPQATRKRPTEQRKMPRQARSKEMVRCLLEATARVLVDEGWDAANTNRIAAVAGVSVGSLYQYFPNKETILVELAEGHIDAGFALLRELLGEALSGEAPLEELLRRFVVAMVALHEHELHRVLFEEAPLPASVRRRLRLRENEFAIEVCALLETHPQAHVRDPKLSAYVLVHTVDALVHNFILHPPKGIGVGELSDELVRMLRGHLESSEA
jgi:AcrR family transcriptional regulator